MGQKTLKDIARELGLSPSTVSRALRDHPDVNQDTKKRVMELADRYLYQPNQIAKSLQTRSSNTIGVIVPQIRHDFFSSVISGVEDLAHEAGYVIMVCQSNDLLEKEKTTLSALLSHRVAGILLSISQETEGCDHLQAVIRQGVPLVLFDRVLDCIDVPQVVVDDREGALGAVRHLLKAGYRRIAHLGGASHISVCQERLKGYTMALAEYGIPIAPELIVYGGLLERNGYQGVDRLMQLAEPPEAIFAVNDPVALGAMVRLKELDISIPRDVALVGFTNTSVTGMVDPPLTTVHQPAHTMGRTAVKLLLDHLQTGCDIHERVIHTLKTRLIVRASA